MAGRREQLLQQNAAHLKSLSELKGAVGDGSDGDGGASKAAAGGGAGLPRRDDHSLAVAVMGAEPLVTADALLPLRLQMPILSCSLTMLSTSSLPQPGMKQGKRNCSGKGALSWLARRACVLIWIGR